MTSSSSARHHCFPRGIGARRAYSGLSITSLVLHSAVLHASAADTTTGLANATASSTSASQGSAAASHASHGSSGHSSAHHQWHVYGYEYSFIECVILVCLILMAVLFEVLYHAWLHTVEHSYEFGIPRSKRHHKKNKKSLWKVVLHNPFSTDGRGVGKRKDAAQDTHVHKDHGHEHEGEVGHAHHENGHGHGGRHAHGKLWKQLAARAGGEFMILGFLALAVYLFNKSGGFDELPVGVRGDGFHYPDSPTAWLHMTEDVHMKLFFAMMIYFVSASHMLYGCVSRLMTLEHVQNHVFTKALLCSTPREKLEITSGGLWHCLVFTDTANGWISRGRSYNSDALVSEYTSIREFFIDRIIGWESSWPEAFAEVREVLDIQAPYEPHQVRASLEDRLAFSTYWALILEEALGDMIQMPTRTWLCLVVETILFGAVCRAAVDMDWILAFVVFYLVLVTLCILFSLVVIRGRRKHILSSDSKVEDPGGEQGLAKCLKCCARQKLEMYLIWFWEVVRFSTIYQIAWIIFDFFLGFRDYSAGDVVLYLFIFFFELALLGFSSVIDMYFVLALPPFIDEGNLDTLIHVLHDTRAFRIDGERRKGHSPDNHTDDHQHHDTRRAAEDTEQLLAPEVFGKPEKSQPDLPGQNPPNMQNS